MSPTCSSNPLAGSTARSATVRITVAGVLSQLATQTQAELSQPHSGVRSRCDAGCRARGRSPLGRAAGGTARGARARGGSRRLPLRGRPPAERPRARRLRRRQRQYRPSGLRAARVGGAGAQRAGPGHLRRRPRATTRPPRRELRRQIAKLEAALVAPPARQRSRSGERGARRRAALLSTEGLEAVRDELVARLQRARRRACRGAGAAGAARGRGAARRRTPGNAEPQPGLGSGGSAPSAPERARDLVDRARARELVALREGALRREVHARAGRVERDAGQLGAAVLRPGDRRGSATRCRRARSRRCRSPRWRCPRRRTPRPRASRSSGRRAAAARSAEASPS